MTQVAAKTETDELVEKYGRLNDSNQKLLFAMASHIKNKGTKEFEKGQARPFIVEIADKFGISFATANRIFYTYIAKYSYEEIIAIVNEKNDGLQTFSNSSAAKDEEKTSTKLFANKIYFKNMEVDAHLIDEKYYFSIDKLFDVLPISENNKAMRNAFSVRGRKMVEINNESVHCIEAEKVKSFLSQFLRQLQEGTQKNDIRILIDSIHRLITKNDFTFVTEIKPKNHVTFMNPSTVSSQAAVIVETKKETPQTKVVGTEIKKAHQQKQNPPFTMKDNAKIVQVPTQAPVQAPAPAPAVVAETKEPLINEDNEIRTLVKMLNQTIGYLSPDARKKLEDITKNNGLVHTVLATSKMLSEIEKDTSLYFVNMIEEHVKECL